MAGRVTTDDLALAELALANEADTYTDEADPTRLALLRVAGSLYMERQRRYRRMAYRTIPDPLGFRQVVPAPSIGAVQ